MESRKQREKDSHHRHHHHEHRKRPREEEPHERRSAHVRPKTEREEPDDHRRRKERRRRDDNRTNQGPPMENLRVRIKQEPVSSDEENQRPVRHERRRHERGEDPSRSRWDDSGDEGRRNRHRDRYDRGPRGGPSSSSGGRQGEGGPRNDSDAPEQPKEQPNLEPSGKLAEETNMYKGIFIKYSEPDDAKKPRTRWRLYVFKGEENLPTMHIHRQSAYLLGRERRIADIPLDHPSCSKQHAALQYRVVPPSRRPRPYVMDLESANGTFLNNQKLESRRYVELFERDVLRFGYSSREYVLLHEGSKGELESGGGGSQSPPAPSPGGDDDGGNATE